MSEPFTSECTYYDIAKRANRTVWHIRKVARDMGLEQTLRRIGRNRRYCRVFAPEQANKIINFFNSCGEPHHKPAPKTERPAGLMTVDELAKRLGMRKREVLFRIAALSIAPAKNIYVTGVGARVYYSEEQAERILRWGQRQNSNEAAQKSTGPTAIAPEWVTIRWFADKLHADCAEVYKAVNALGLFAALRPGGTADTQLVQHYQSKYLRAVRLQINAMRAQDVTVIRRAAEEEDY